MSTSQTPQTLYESAGPGAMQYPLCIGGFGPNCHDGYGVSYIILGDDVCTYITCLVGCS